MFVYKQLITFAASMGPSSCKRTFGGTFSVLTHFLDTQRRPFNDKTVCGPFLRMFCRRRLAFLFNSFVSLTKTYHRHTADNNKSHQQSKNRATRQGDNKLSLKENRNNLNGTLTLLLVVVVRRRLVSSCY